MIYSKVGSHQWAMILLSAIIGHSALHWLMERGEIIVKYPLPIFDIVFVIGLMRALIAALVLVFFLWLIVQPINRFLSQTPAQGE